MSDITSANDRQTLKAIGRIPGVKRSSPSVVRASVDRLIRAGLVTPPTTSGKLFLTDAGMAELDWEPMKPSELGRFVCVADCRHPSRDINADGVWFRSGGQFSSGHRDCYQALREGR